MYKMKKFYKPKGAEAKNLQETKQVGGDCKFYCSLGHGSGEGNGPAGRVWKWSLEDLGHIHKSLFPGLEPWDLGLLSVEEVMT